jgi:4-amino-4-deoxy-L-arabinose transferase-like glycosyltransferase
VVVLVALVLAPPDIRRTVALLTVAGLFAAAGKIWLIQQAPQWQDMNPDLITYDLNGQAFALHWRGEPVDADAFNLRGVKTFHKAGLHGPIWEPDDWLSYQWVIGSGDWLYTAYVGLWYFVGADQRWVIGSNAIWAAIFPAAAFGIALAIGATRKAALAAGVLALLDPSAGVNASWLLKDTLVGFIAMASLWAVSCLIERKKDVSLVLFSALGLALLGISRYVAFLAVFIATLAYVGHEMLKRHPLPWRIVTALVLAWACLDILSYLPHVPQTVTAPLTAIGSGLGTLQAMRGDENADGTTLRWKESLAQNPALAVVKSVAHTLFAPYPWVAISPGLTWWSGNELYYPGVVLWMICLPGIGTALWIGVQQGRPTFWIVAIFLACLLAAYTVFQGEWSTRQRVFALPAFFALAGIGWAELGQCLRHRVLSRGDTG